MGLRKILDDKDPALHKVCRPVEKFDAKLHKLLDDMAETLEEANGVGLAAPQIGIQKRLLYMYLDKAYVFINPVMTFPDEETYELMDDCMSFPGLMVKVCRYRRCVIRYLDLDFQPREMALEGDLSELLQHEYDHLDGILATMRAVDNKSLYLQQMKRDF